MAMVGSTCLQQDTNNLSDQNHIVLLIRVSQILMKETSEFINIYQAWPILSQAKKLSYREISSDRHTMDHPDLTVTNLVLVEMGCILKQILNNSVEETVLNLYSFQKKQ